MQGAPHEQSLRKRFPCGTCDLFNDGFPCPRAWRKRLRRWVHRRVYPPHSGLGSSSQRGLVSGRYRVWGAAQAAHGPNCCVHHGWFNHWCKSWFAVPLGRDQLWSQPLASGVGWHRISDHRRPGRRNCDFDACVEFCSGHSVIYPAYAATVTVFKRRDGLPVRHAPKLSVSR